MSRYAALLVFLSAFFAFSSSLGNGFAFDDRIHITENARITNLERIDEIFGQPMYPGNLYRPLVEASYALTYHFFGLNPLPYHFTNITMHGAVAVLVYQLLIRLFSRGFALGVGLLFAVHPLAVEAVANVSGRTELLCALFGLGAILCSLSLNAVGTSLLLLLALLCKESGFVFFLLIPLALYYRGRPFTAATCLALLFAGTSYLTLRVDALGTLFGNVREIDYLDNPIAALPIAERALNAFALLGRAISLGLVPLQHSADYSFAQLAPLAPLDGWASVKDYLYFLPFSLLLTLLVGLAKLGRTGFGAAWFFAAFSVTSNVLFPIGTIFAERLSYLPLIGLLCVIVSLSSLIHSRTLQGTILAVLCIGFGSVSALRATIWENDASLTTHQLMYSPKSAKTQLNYGASLLAAGDQENARKHFEQALNIAPGYAEALYALGALQLRQGNLSAAAEWLQRSLAINSAHVPSLNALATVHLARRELISSQSLFEQSLRLRPENRGGMFGMLALTIERGDLKSGAALLNRIKALYPNDPQLAEFEKALQAPTKSS